MISWQEEKRRYYTYFADGTDSWHVKTPPVRNRYFERELETLAGRNPFGKPVLRIVWAGRHLSDISAAPTLKYKQIWRGKRFYFVNDENREITVTHPDQVPADKMMRCRNDWRELGRLRWIIEKWQSADSAARDGRCSPEAVDEEGNRLFRDLPPEGVYNHWWRIETAAGEFRDLDDEVLTTAKRIWRYQESTPAERQLFDAENYERRERERADADINEIWERPPDGGELERAIEEVAREKEYLSEAARRSSRIIFS